MDTIMVCVDSSRISERILDAGIDLARAFGVPIHLVTVHTEGSSSHVTAQSDYQAQRAKVATEASKKFQALSARAKENAVGCTVNVGKGDVVDFLVAEARRVNPRMIVMGSHGKGAVHHLVVGSVAGGVLKNLGLPVVLVPVDPKERPST